MTMIDRNPEGRVTGEGLSFEAVQDRTLQDELADLVREMRKLRLALTLRGVAEDIGDLQALQSLLE